jgi:UDP-N-acetylmuramate: L-alanyl-gamma-D-glutamyl-meso-diaminopimelate ligase
LIKEAKLPIFRYGFKEDSDIFISNLRQKESKQVFDLKIKDRQYLNIEISLSGKHNVLNSVAAFAIAVLEDLNEEKIRQGLSRFSGVKKRQEVLYDQNNTLVIDDYAHHPTAVKTTLEGLKKKYPEKEIVAIFEPRSNTSRMKVFQEEYLKSFGEAGEVILAVPSFRENDQKENFIDIDKLVFDLNRKGIRAENLENAENIFEKIKDDRGEGKMFIVMSNGDFGHLAQRLADYFLNN